MSEGPSLRFPFEWPDAHAPAFHWRRQTANGPLRPLQEDVALALRGLEDQEEHDVQEPSPKEGHGPHWRDLVTARAAVHEWRKQLEAPETLGGPPPPGVQDRPGMEPPPGTGAPGGAGGGTDRPEPPEDALVVGQSGSAGVATGRVRILDRHDVVPEVEKGDVLVARNTSPLWAPVFPAAAAVVLDASGFFQHAMLTCREYGVPVVFQTKDASQKLAEGQRVTVGGTNGWVLPGQ